jgi:RHS repeat-associated protein
MSSNSFAAQQTVTYYLTDPHGSVLATADASGAVTSTRDFTPYGKSAEGGDSDGPGYTGHVGDADTGMIYMQARYFDPESGRFLSVDTERPQAGNLFVTNRFVYGDNNPTTKWDPSGRCVWDLCIAEITIVEALLVSSGAAVVTQQMINTSRDNPSTTLPVVVLPVALVAYEITSTQSDSVVQPSTTFTDIEGNKTPFTGTPGSTVRGGTGSRKYGPDGYPLTDRDLPHPDEKGIGSQDHCHDWSRCNPGQRPSSTDRGPPRPPTPDDPPEPRGPNVPPPDPSTP